MITERMDRMVAAGTATDKPRDAIYDWLPKNFVGKDEWGRPTPFLMEPHLARILTDIVPPGATELPYRLVTISTAKKCVAPETRVLTDDLRWVPAGSLAVGDGLLAFDEHIQGDKRGGSRRRYRAAKVLDTGREVRRCKRLTLSDGTQIVCSEEHPWLTRDYGPLSRKSRTSGLRKGTVVKRSTALAWKRTDELRPGFVLTRFLPTWETGDSFDDGWVSGFAEGEAHVKRNATDLSMGQKSPAALDRLKEIAGRYGFECTTYWQRRLSGPYPGPDYAIWSICVSGRQNIFHFLGRFRPKRLLDKILANLDGIGLLYSMADVEIVAIEDLDHEVVTLETSTATYFAEGFAAHNSGKTLLNAAIMTYLAFEWFPQGSELYVFANSLEQAQGRVYQAAKYAVEHNGKLRKRCDEVFLREIRLTGGTIIRAQAAKDANIAGSEPAYSAWTELWGFVLEAERRAWDEMTPPPTVTNSMRVVDTYAGWEGESDLLWDIYQRAMHSERWYEKGFEDPATGIWHDTPLPVYVDKEARFYALWDTGEEARRMPWQRGDAGKAYYAQQAHELRPGAFKRLHLNQWARREDAFVMLAEWNLCSGAKRWAPGDKEPIVLAADASKNDDHMALVGARWIDGVPHICYVKEWEPQADERMGGARVVDPGDIEREIIRLKEAGMRIRCVAYDAYQFHAVALRLAERHFEMIDFSQGERRLKADTALHDRIREGTIRHSNWPSLNLAVASAAAKEYKDTMTEKKAIRIIKGTGKVDPLVAASMAIAVLEEVGYGVSAVAMPGQKAQRKTALGGRQLRADHAKRPGPLSVKVPRR